jgi:hypothetical protein
MATALPVPALGGGWTLRATTERSGTSREFTASLDGGPEIVLHIHRVRHHPLRACYPYGDHDLAVDLTVAEPEVPALLRELVPALFAASPRCRRVIAAPDERDIRAQEALEAGGFLRIAEADLPDRSVVLLVAEPPTITALSTALDDMPH